MSEICEYCATDLGGINSDLNTFVQDEGEALAWCGQCRSGSLAYFNEMSSFDLADITRRAEEILDDDPINWHEEKTNPLAHAKKLAIDDEIYRSKRELVFRLRGY